MKVSMEVPLNYVIGVELKTNVPGRATIELGMLNCKIPLPPECVAGKATLNLTVHTMEGDIQFEAKNVPGVRLQPFKFAEFAAEEIVIAALGKGQQDTLIKGVKMLDIGDEEPSS